MKLLLVLITTLAGSHGLLTTDERPHIILIAEDTVQIVRTSIPAGTSGRRFVRLRVTGL